MKIQARALQPGDRLGSDELVVLVSAGVRTPSGKVEVVLTRGDGQRRRATWVAYTLINVVRS